MREWPASVLYTPCYKDETMHSAKSQYSTQYCLAILEARQPQLDYFCINSFYVSFTSISKIAQYANISLFMTRVKDWLPTFLDWSSFFKFKIRVYRPWFEVSYTTRKIREGLIPLRLQAKAKICDLSLLHVQDIPSLLGFLQFLLTRERI